MRKFSAIVKVFLISILLSVNSFADDFLKSESYTPGGEYRLFGSGRGSVSNIRGGFNESWQFGITAGNIAVNNLTYTGTVDYQQDFSGHGSLRATANPSWFESKTSVEHLDTTTENGLKLSSVYVKGREIHPADGYDGPQGGGYPKPTGARDEYHYDVTAHVTTIKVVSIEKLNQVLPPERKITETERKKLQNGEKLSQERYIELIITAENNKDFLQAQEITAKIPENCRRFCQIGGVTEIPQSMVPQPETPVTADKHGFLYYLGNAALDILPGTSDYRAWKEADGFWDKTWVVAGATPFGKYAKTGRQVLKTADELNDVRKLKNSKTIAKNSDKSAENSPHIWTQGKEDSPVHNAYTHWNKHGSDFPQYQNAKQYVEGANDFVTNPPSGTLTKVRTERNPGDTVYYHPESNTFAIKNKKGEVKTLYKPTRGKAYFDEQK